MSNKKLHISADLSFAIDAVTETFGIFGRRGSGKSHTGSVFAEEMLKVRVPVVAYDPTGAWYGLKSSVDGKSAGFPVVIFGGDHADVPLNEEDGEMIARAIVSERFPAILDCSLLRKGARLRLMADFLETLYHENREAVHFFADEVHTIAPLNVRNVGEASVYQSRCIGAIEDIILQGRRRGIGMTGMSQRPALVNASVRSQFGTLIAMKIVSPLDRKAVADWIEEKGTEEEGEKLLEQLPRLENGQGIVWSTVYDILKTVRFRQRETFDSGRTPGVGEKRIEPKKWATIDVDALGATIAAKRQEKIDNDPARLKADNAKLKKELAQAQAKPAAPAPPKKVDVKRVEVPVLKDGQLKRVEKIHERAANLVQSVAELVKGLTEPMGHIAAAMEKMGQPAPAFPAPALPTPSYAPPRPPRMALPAARPSNTATKSAPRSKANGDGGGITPRQQRFLDAAASLTTLNTEVTRETVAAWVGVHPRGGSVGEELKALEENGLIENNRGEITVTAAGMSAAGKIDPSKAIERAMSGLSNRQKKFFDVIVAAHPKGVTREAIAQHFEIHPRGGSLGEDLGRLVGRGLVEGNRGVYRARDFLFAGAVDR